MPQVEAPARSEYSVPCALAQPFPSPLACNPGLGWDWTELLWKSGSALHRALPLEGR